MVETEMMMRNAELAREALETRTTDDARERHRARMARAMALPGWSYASPEMEAGAALAESLWFLHQIPWMAEVWERRTGGTVTFDSTQTPPDGRGGLGLTFRAASGATVAYSVVTYDECAGWFYGALTRACNDATAGWVDAGCPR